MDDVALIASGLPASRNCHIAVLPDSSHHVTSIYLFYKDSRLAYTFEFHESNRPKCVDIRTLVFSSPPLEIFTLASRHCVLLDDGCIYMTPATVGNAVATVPKASYVTTESNTQGELALPKATTIPERCKLFQNKSCRAVCSLRDVVCMLCSNGFHWSVNIYKFNISTSSTSNTIRLVGNVDLPTMLKKPFKPYMASFVLGNGIEENEIDSQLCQYIFGSELPLHCEGMVLVSFCDGSIFFIPVVTDLLCDICAFPLFCFHEPVVKIQKVSVKTDSSRNEVGILFVGISGKVIILSRSKHIPQEKGPCITEFHLPGPIHLWSGCGGIAFHTDETATLWKTTFKRHNFQEEGSSLMSLSSNEYVKACGISLFNNQEPSPYVLLCAESGNLTFIKNYEKSSLISPAYWSTLKPMDLKELLTSIHECSEQISKIYENKERKKRVLSELSCAAHLIINDKARNNFTVGVIPEWTSAKPNQIIITVKLASEGEFSIIGHHWHFVVKITTASGRCLSKSIPLKGFEAGQKVEVKIRIKVGDIVTNNDLPFTVAGGLQLFLDVHEDNVINVHLKTSCYQPPVSFFVNLAETSLDVLGFLSSNMDVEFTRYEPSITDALWELARSRQASIFHDIDNKFSVPDLEMFKFNYITVKKSFIEKHIKKQGVPEGPFLTSFLAFIVSKSEIVLPNGICDIELSIFGRRIKLVVREDGINIQMKIIVWCPSLLAKLRFAILQKLQLINYQKPYAAMSKQKQIEGFVLRPAVLKSCLTLNSRLLQLSSVQEENHSNFISHIYAEMRELVSSELPFV